MPGFDPLCMECAFEVLGDRIATFTTGAQLAEAIEYFRFARGIAR